MLNNFDESGKGRGSDVVVRTLFESFKESVATEHPLIVQARLGISESVYYKWLTKCQMLGLNSFENKDLICKRNKLLSILNDFAPYQIDKDTLFKIEWTGKVCTLTICDIFDNPQPNPPSSISASAPDEEPDELRSDGLNSDSSEEVLSPAPVVEVQGLDDVGEDPELDEATPQGPGESSKLA
jgi:hypothetical protein